MTHGPPPETESAARLLDRCLLCASRELSPEPFVYEHEGERYPSARCRACGFVFLTRQPAAATLERMYGPEYFEADYHCGLESASYFDREAEETAGARRILERLEGAMPRGRLLEVGCAGGYFLQAARARGWQAAGIEYSEEASHFARERLGLDVRTGTLAEAAFADGSFDAVYMGDVLEHVTDPLATLAEVRRVLRPGGILALAGPITIHSLDRRLLRWVFARLGWTRPLRLPPYHLLEFTPRTLAEALRRGGFEVVLLEQAKIPPQFGNPAGRPALEHLARLAFEIPSWAWTALTGRAGDRVFLLARRA
jgi:SAM-dependent methyltransferase